MSLLNTRLKGNIKTDIIALNSLMKVAPLSDDDYADKLAEAIANRVVAEITGDAVVPSGITVSTPDTVSGTTTGTGTVQ